MMRARLCPIARTIMTNEFLEHLDTTLQNVFKMMLTMDVSCAGPTDEAALEAEVSVSAIIALSGDVVGAVIMSFPSATALAIANHFTGMELQETDDDLADAIGELANMVAGGAKSLLKGKSVTISCPSVVLGDAHRIQVPKDQVCLYLTCTSDKGQFLLRFCSNTNVAIGAKSAAA